MHSADYAVAKCLSVRLSVCHTTYQTGWQYTDGDPPNGGAKCKGEYEKRQFVTNIGLYLGTDARQSHSYYRK